MGVLGRLDLITAAFAEAAVDASRWDAAMETVREATGSAGAILFPVEGRLPALPHSRSLEPSMDAYIRDGWIKRDERDRIRPVLDQRGVGTDLDFITAEGMARHPYYQEFLAPHGLQWFAGVKVASGDDLWCLSVQRSIGQGPFSPAALRELGVLSTHLSASAALARALGFAKAEGALSAFEASGTAAVLLDRHGKALCSNAAAERLFGPDIDIRHGRLVSASHAATATLDRTLHALLWRSPSMAMAPPVPLPRRSGRPILAYPLWLRGLSANALAPCQAVVVLVDMEGDRCPSEDALRSLFGLTPAEARLAGQVATGAPIEAIAGRAGITYETARNQLKAVLAKTNTHRQAELVSLLARLPPKP